MKKALRKTEFRKTTAFTLFTLLVLGLLYLDARADRLDPAGHTPAKATVAAAIASGER